MALPYQIKFNRFSSFKFSNKFGNYFTQEWTGKQTCFHSILHQSKIMSVHCESNANGFNSFQVHLLTSALWPTRWQLYEERSPVCSARLVWMDLLSPFKNITCVKSHVSISTLFWSRNYNYFKQFLVSKIRYSQTWV